MAKPTWENEKHNFYRALTGGNSNNFDLDGAVQEGVDWVNDKFNGTVSFESVLAYLKEHPNLNQYQAAKKIFDLENDNN